MNEALKVQPHHLERGAYVLVRPAVVDAAGHRKCREHEAAIRAPQSRDSAGLARRPARRWESPDSRYFRDSVICATTGTQIVSSDQWAWIYLCLSGRRRCLSIARGRPANRSSLITDHACLTRR